MPYDSTKIRDLLRAAPQHRAMPNGEFVLDLSDQLLEAEKQVAIEAAKVRKAHEETADVQRKLDDEVAAHRKFRESATGHAQMVDALRAIAKSPKGAQKLALETLTAAGLGDIPLTTSK